GKLVVRNKISDVVDFVMSQEADSKALIIVKLKEKKDRTLSKQLELLNQGGFSRVITDTGIQKITDLDLKKIKKNASISLLVDRIVVQKNDEDLLNRISDSVQTAFFEGDGECDVTIEDPSSKSKTYHFSN